MAPTGRREAKKEQTRAALESAAWRLFERDGYDATAIDAIAEAAGVSRRTFFRYFDSKESVLFGEWRADLDRLRDRLLEQPADRPLLVAIAEGMRAFGDDYEERRETHLHRARIAATSEHAGRYQYEVLQPAWQEVLTDAIATRLGASRTDLRPRVWAAVAVGVTTAVVFHWLERDGAEWLPELLASAFEDLRIEIDASLDGVSRSD